MLFGLRYVQNQTSADALRKRTTTRPTGINSGAGTTNPEGPFEFASPPPSFRCIGVNLWFSVKCFVDHCLSFCSFLVTIVLSAIRRFTYSDYFFGFFKLFMHIIRIVVINSHVHHTLVSFQPFRQFTNTISSR